MRRLIIVSTVSTALFLSGCAHGGVKPVAQPTKPVDPVVKAKQEFREHYGFLITEKEKVSYYQETIGVTDKENKIFKDLKTVEDLGKFEEVFWKVRDTDPNTPENEFKELIDSRIEDVKNEIFSRDMDTPGARFDRNGGLTGDMAHVYLLYGKPHYKEKLSQNQYHVELMVWYYFDEDGKPLFRFLFYDKYGSYKLFKRYGVIFNFDYLIDPLTSPLREISIEMAPTARDLYELWMNLVYYEGANAFVVALLEFSYYSDVVIEGGDGKKRFGALDPPEPAALTAERHKPRIIGEPEDLSGKEMFFGKYPSFIPAYVRLMKAADGSPSLALIILYQNIDWEIKGGKAECKLALNINILNKNTAESVQFSTALTIGLAKADDAKAVRSIYVSIDEANGANSYGSPMKFRDFAKKLPAGDYIIDIDFLDLRTMKSGVAIQEFKK